MTDPAAPERDHPERRAWLGLLASAPAHALRAALTRIDDRPPFTWLRQPECGLVMVQARSGGSGARFNLGEASATRCVLRIDGGPVGVGHVLGTDAGQCGDIALCDAMLQDPRYADAVREQVLEPLDSHEQDRRTERAARMERSRVDFFTLVRGDD